MGTVVNINELLESYKMNTYLFFNEKGVLGTSQGNNVNNAFLNMFGIPYDLKSSEEILYRILSRAEEGL